MMVASRPSAGGTRHDCGRPFRAGSRHLRIAAHHRRGAGAQDRAAPARPPRHRPGYRLRDGPVHAAAARAAAGRLAAGRQRRLGGPAGTPQQNARTIWGRYFPGFTEHEQRLHDEAALRDAVRQTGGLQVFATQTFRHPRSSTAGRLRAQAEGRHYSTFSLYPPDALHASIATFLARLPGPEVCWVDEHLLVVVGGRRRNQVEPDDSSGLASQAITDPALQSSAGRAGEASGRPLSLATRVMIEKTRNLAGPAGAAVLAAPPGGSRAGGRQSSAAAA